VYFTVTSNAADSIVGVFTLSELAIHNFETRVVQQFAEFFTRIWWVLVGRYELMGVLKCWKCEINLLKTRRTRHYIYIYIYIYIFSLYITGNSLCFS